MDVYSFKADEKLVGLAFNAAEKVSAFSVFKRRIVSGDQVIAATRKVASLRETFEALSVEMEGAAIV